MCAAPGSKTI